MIAYTLNGQTKVGINCTGTAILLKCWDEDSQTNTLLTPGGARGLAKDLLKLADILESTCEDYQVLSR